MGKKETISLIDTFSEFKELKNIDRSTLISVMEESFRNVLAKMFGTDENFDVIINPDKGDFEIYRNRKVVEDGQVQDENLEIALSEARKIDEDYEVGEEVTDTVNFIDFGRRAILTLRQTLASKILDLQKEGLYTRYSEMVGQIVSAELYQIWKREMLLLDEDGNELYLPKSEQIPTDFYRKGDTVRAVVAMVDNQNNNPKIILSRTSPLFLQRLFELEVPEIQDGLITIKKIARIPGERAKIAVESYDDRVDPVGACVGVKGARIHGIVRELRNENIDVINYTSNVNLFISRALSPAKVSSIRVIEEEKRAEVYLRPEEVSLAIGKGGLNIKLAGMLTGYTLDVFRELDEAEETEDIYLDEFTDEIDEWIIETLKSIGCDTQPRACWPYRVMNWFIGAIWKKKRWTKYCAYWQPSSRTNKRTGGFWDTWKKQGRSAFSSRSRDKNTNTKVRHGCFRGCLMLGLERFNKTEYMPVRLSKALKDLNVGLSTAVEFLAKKGQKIEASPNYKLSDEQYMLLLKEFNKDMALKQTAEQLGQQRQSKEKGGKVSIEGYGETPKKDDVVRVVVPEEQKPHLKTVGHIDLEPKSKKEEKERTGCRRNKRRSQTCCSGQACISRRAARGQA